MHSVDSWLPPYASPCRTPVFQVAGKSQDRKFTAGMAEKQAGKPTLRATFTEGESEPGHDNRNQRQPPCNRAPKRLLRGAHGVFPRGLATHLRKCRLCKIRDGFLSEGFLDSRRVPFTGCEPGTASGFKGHGAARHNFNFRLPTLTVPLNQVRREVT